MKSLRFKVKTSDLAISNVEVLHKISEALKTIMASLFHYEWWIVDFYDTSLTYFHGMLLSKDERKSQLFSSGKYIHGLFTYAFSLHIQTFQVKILKESILLLFTTFNIPSHVICPMKVDKYIARVVASHWVIIWFHLFVHILNKYIFKQPPILSPYPLIIIFEIHHQERLIYPKVSASFFFLLKCNYIWAKKHNLIKPLSCAVAQ